MSCLVHDPKAAESSGVVQVELREFVDDGREFTDVCKDITSGLDADYSRQPEQPGAARSHIRRGECEWHAHRD